MRNKVGDCTETVLRKQNYLEQRLNVGEDKRLKLIKTWQANTVFYILIDFVRYQRVKLMSFQAVEPYRIHRVTKPWRSHLKFQVSRKIWDKIDRKKLMAKVDSSSDKTSWTKFVYLRMNFKLLHKSVV